MSTTIPTELVDRFKIFWNHYTTALAFGGCESTGDSEESEESESPPLYRSHFNPDTSDVWDEIALLLTEDDREALMIGAEKFFLAAVPFIPEDDELTGLAGRDFYYTTTGAGCGFWDGDWDNVNEEFDVGKKLAELAKEYPAVELMGQREAGELTSCWIYMG